MSNEFDEVSATDRQRIREIAKQLDSGDTTCCRTDEAFIGKHAAAIWNARKHVRQAAALRTGE